MRPVERLEAGVDAGAGEAGGEHARLGGEAGMDGLVMVPNCDMKPAGHAGRDRDRIAGLARRRAEQAGAGGGGADRADRGGGVPAAVAVRRVHALADPAEDLQPGDVGVEAVAARGAFLLGQGEDRRDEDGGGVSLGRIEIVVEVERMGGGAVDQGRPGRGERGALADRGGGAGAPVPDRLEHAARDRLDRAGDGDGDDVDELAVGRLPRRLGPAAGLGEPASVGEDGVVGHAVT